MRSNVRNILAHAALLALLAGCAGKAPLPRKLTSYQDVVIFREKVVPIRGFDVKKTRLGKAPAGATDVVARLALYGSYAPPAAQWRLTIDGRPVRVNAQGDWAVPIRLKGRETVVEAVATGPEGDVERENLRITLYATDRAAASTSDW